MKQLITIVIPVYREVNNLERLYERLEKMTGALPVFTWEYLLVNDGSPDHSL